MKNDYKSKLMAVWNRVKANVKMDSAAKAKIAVEAVTGLQKAVDPDRHFRVSPDFPFGSPETPVHETRMKPLSPWLHRPGSIHNGNPLVE